MTMISIKCNKRLFFYALVIIFLIFFESPLMADSDITETIATGYGVDQEKALRSAFRTAIEQSIGVVIDSETLVKNYTAIKDDIFSYSNGYIEEYSKIDDGKNYDGLYFITIKAKVKNRKLTGKLKEMNITVKKVDGSSLFGEVFTSVEQQNNAAELLKKTLSDINIPISIIKGDISQKQPEIIEKDESGAKVKWIAEVKYDEKIYYETIVPKLLNTLGDIAKAKSNLDMITNSDEQLSDFDYPLLTMPKGHACKFGLPIYKFNNVEDDIVIFVNTAHNKDNTNLRWKWFILDKAKCNNILEKYSKKSLKIRIALMENENNVIREDSIDVGPYPYGFELFPGFIWQVRLQCRDCSKPGNTDALEGFTISPYFKYDYASDGTTYNSLCNVIYTPRLSMEEMKLINFIKVFFEEFDK